MNQSVVFNAVEIFALVDKKDTISYLDFFAEEASFKFGNYPAAVGKEAIKSLVEDVFSSVSSLAHYNLETFSCNGGEVVVSNGEVTYTRHDGVIKSYPFSGTYKLNNGKINEYQVYIDNHDLFA